MHIKILIALLFASNILEAQILDINKPLFSDEPFFNSQFIKANKIKSIQGSRSSKKVKDIIRSKGLDFYYIFNSDGALTNQMSTFHNPIQSKDTNIIDYTYNQDHQLTIIRKSDAYGYYSHRYFYNNDNNIIRQTYYREENKCPSKNHFELAKEYIIMNDSFSYEKLSENQIKKIFYNNYHKPYKECISYYDDLGYLKEEYTKHLIGNKKSRITYEYDEKGRVFKIINTPNLNTKQQTTEIYSYDELNNVLEIKIHNNDTYTTSKQFLYDKKTYLLTAQIIQDVATEFIRIIQYQYTFFNGESTSLSLEEN